VAQSHGLLGFHLNLVLGTWSGWYVVLLNSHETFLWENMKNEFLQKLKFWYCSTSKADAHARFMDIISHVKYSKLKYNIWIYIIQNVRTSYFGFTEDGTLSHVNNQILTGRTR
jgi:hypothetical protein